jgi:hypothetical protein
MRNFGIKNGFNSKRSVASRLHIVLISLLLIKCRPAVRYKVAGKMVLFMAARPRNALNYSHFDTKNCAFRTNREAYVAVGS